MTRVETEVGRRRLEAHLRRVMAAQPTVEPWRHTGGRVGIATFGSGAWHLVLEGLLAHALRLRGADVELLVCDIPTLPLCDERTVLSRQTDECPGCLEDKRELLDVLALPWRGLSAFVRPGESEEAAHIVAALPDEALTAHREDGWPVGEWLHVSASHFLRCDARGNTPDRIDVRRRLLVSAIVVTRAVSRWLDATRPDAVVAESGAHFMWRIALELSRARGIRVVCREIGKGGFDHHIYAMNADAMSPGLEHAWEETLRVPLTAAEDRQVDEFLRELPARTYAGAGETLEGDDSISAAADLRRSLHLDARPIAVLFTNVTWDLATAGRDVAFDGVLDWVLAAVDTAGRLPGLQLVIRPHRAEDHVPTRERIEERLAALVPVFPPNVRLVPTSHPVGAPTLCLLADAALAYCSTAGLEAAARGTRTIVCGRPHYRGRGFTVDVESRAALLERLQEVATGDLPAMTAADRRRARQYVHLFFLRYHIPMGWTTSPLEPPFTLRVRSLDELVPGRNPGLDVVCRGILEGTDILLPRMESTT